MARMIPPTVHSKVRSGAERRLFRLIQSAKNTQDWICLHSLGLAAHETKRRAEVDFLLITPMGVFVIEVKGGRVRREGGVWFFTNRFGESNRKSEGPFDQAAGAMFALERYVCEKLGNAWSSVLFGYGVAFPDVEIATVGADADPDLVYDVRDRVRPFSAYMERLARYTRESQPRLRRAPTRKEMTDLASLLRGDFDLKPAFSTSAQSTRAEQEVLTTEQQGVLDALEEEPRVLVDGPAGSGKTILALEAARRDARAGRRVLCLCYNRLLATRMRAELDGEAFSQDVHVSTIHGFFRALIENSSLIEEFRERSLTVNERGLFDELLPEYAAMAALERAGPPFDTLVVDEAQDVLTRSCTTVLDESLRAGLIEGRWRFFLDANNQASVYGRLDPDLLKELRQVAPVAVLTTNCRNTRPIALQTNVVAAPRRRAEGRIEGAPVEFLSYRDHHDCVGKLEKVLSDLRHEGVTPGSVSVLFPRQPDDATRRRLDRLGIRRISETEVGAFGRIEDTYWSPVSGFKGLENDVVILVGVEDIEQAWWRGVTYVGMSRARVRLYVILRDDCNAVRRKRLCEETERRLGEVQ